MESSTGQKKEGKNSTRIGRGEITGVLPQGGGPKGVLVLSEPELRGFQHTHFKSRKSIVYL